MNLFDTIPPVFLGLITGTLYAIGRLIYVHFQDKEAEKIFNKTYRDQVKQLIKDRKKISIKNINPTSENDFWELIDLITKKSKGSYKNFLGLFKDYLLEQEGQQILELYLATLNMLVKTNNYNLVGAFTIITNSIKFYNYDIFGSWLLTRGQVLYNNSINNPELIRNIEIKDIVEETVIDLICECYEIRTRQIIPEFMDFEAPEIEGEQIELEELADTYPGLWEKFIIIKAE